MTDKQRAWVEHYLTCWNATDAARQAGYSYPGRRGAENLRHPRLRNLIAERITELAMAADETLGRISSIARADISDFIDVSLDGSYTLNLLKAQERGTLYALKKLSYDREGNPRIELHDKTAALQLLMRHHGMLVDRLQIDHTITLSTEAFNAIQAMGMDVEDLSAQFNRYIVERYRRGANQADNGTN